MGSISAKSSFASIRDTGCALALLLASQCWSFADLSGNGNFLVTLADPQMTLSAPACTNGQIQFSLTCESGVSYVIESSPDMVNWTPVATNNDVGQVRAITLPACDAAGF